MLLCPAPAFIQRADDALVALFERGDPMIFLNRPISLAILLMALALLLIVILPQLRTTREKVFQE